MTSTLSLSADPVPFLDLGAATAELRAELGAALERVLDSGWYVLGREVADFEAAFAGYVGARHALGVANGLDALTLLLRAVGVSPGDEVIVPAHTFVATWLAVTACGAVPVPVDVRRGTGNIDPELVDAAVTARTTAIVPVHLYGQPADMDPLVELAARRGLAIVEDAAQAHGARQRDRPVGTFGAGAGWSFYPGKNLGALGDGGAVTTDVAEVAARVASLRNYGSTTKYVHTELGVNSRLDDLQAAVLSAKLRVLDEWNARRRGVAQRYLAELQGLEWLDLPVVEWWADPVWHLFVVATEQRDALQAHLAEAGITTLVHYPIPPHQQRAYEHLGHRAGEFPVAERLAAQVLSLPIGPQLSSGDVDRVVAAVRSFKPSTSTADV